jgi:TRAP-type C4-dicarboxylate transport system permease small subunit
MKSIAHGVAVGLFVALFTVFIIQISARFLLDRPLPWTDELVMVLYLWIVLWGASFVLKEEEHVRFDLLYNLCSPGVQRGLRIAAHLLIGGLMGWAIPGSWDYIHFMARENTPVMDLPWMWVDAPFLFLLCAVVFKSLRALWNEIGSALR